ncbi:NTE family protein [Acetanaerobacterium elongatum]|uniref:NTE family protein n=2 Tax=Acetanaerobacterium elongatum TaxID=258515 RepID=A0A1H0FJ73_9FIRM|nr:NTE family protein [Acetanaerobacterium elongatum]
MIIFMGFGIAFGGGGTRGAAHVGVLLALTEAGMIPRAVAGTSSGSIVAGLYASGVNIMKLKEMVYHLERNGKALMDPDYKGIFKGLLQLLTGRMPSITGLIKGDKLEQFIAHYTQNQFIKEAQMRVVIPAADLASGRTVVYTNNTLGLPAIEGVLWRDNIRLSEAIRASTAVPVVFRPKTSGDFVLLDGGLSDNLPSYLLAATGEKNILAVDISQNYRRDKGENLLEISTHSLAIMNRRLKNCTSTGEELLLKPKLPQQMGILDFEYMSGCMQAGYEGAKHMMPIIRAMFT